MSTPQDNFIISGAKTGGLGGLTDLLRQGRSKEMRVAPAVEIVIFSVEYRLRPRMPSLRRIRIRIRIDVRCKINTILEQFSAIRIGAERRETTIIFVQDKGCMSRELNNIR